VAGGSPLPAPRRSDFSSAPVDGAARGPEWSARRLAEGVRPGADCTPGVGSLHSAVGEKSPADALQRGRQLLVGRDTPVIWRGPLKIKAIKQMMIDVNWGDLDFMVIDLPPGTSDEPLSIAQEIPDADGAIIVTTPQEVSLLDVRKSIGFAQAVRLPIVGIVENMSGLVCPHCGKTVDVFKRGGGEAAAKELGLPFLGRIPLDPRIVVGGDAGKPFVLEHPDSPAAKAFYGIVREIRKSLKPVAPRPSGPLAR